MAKPTRKRVDGSTPWPKVRHCILTGLVGVENRGRKACRGRIWQPIHDRGHPAPRVYQTATLSPFTFPPPQAASRGANSHSCLHEWVEVPEPPGWRAEPLQPIGCNDSARRFRHRIPIRYMHEDIYSKHSTELERQQR